MSWQHTKLVRCRASVVRRWLGIEPVSCSQGSRGLTASWPVSSSHSVILDHLALILQLHYCYSDESLVLSLFHVVLAADRMPAWCRTDKSDIGPTLEHWLLCVVAMRTIYLHDRSHWTTVSSLGTYPANTKHLYNLWTTSAQRLRRWSNIVQMLYKCFVFAG